VPVRRRLGRLASAPEWCQATFDWLVWRDWDRAYRLASADALPDEALASLFGLRPQSHGDFWRAYEAKALKLWTRVHPGARPESWWEFSDELSEPRRVVAGGAYEVLSGLTRCRATGVPWGRPVDATCVPLFESQATFLERHGLWTRGERVRVAADAFEPERFDWKAVWDQPV